MTESNSLEKNINSIFDGVVPEEDFQRGFIMAFNAMASNSPEELQFFMNLYKENLYNQQMAEGARLFFNFLQNQDNPPEGTLEAIIHYAISSYTVGNKDFFNYLKKLKKIKSAEARDDNSAEIILNSGEVIQFSLLSQYLEDFCDINAEEKKELESSGRLGRCHFGSMLVSQKLGCKNDVVSGETYFFNNKARIPHSWVEVNLSTRRTSIIDYTMNAIMNKEGYEFLTKAKEVSRIRNTIIKEDLESGFIDKLLDICLADKEYVFFRDELFKAMKEIEGRFDDGR